jgi:hypothetical protein
MDTIYHHCVQNRTEVGVGVPIFNRFKKRYSAQYIIPINAIDLKITPPQVLNYFQRPVESYSLSLGCMNTI